MSDEVFTEGTRVYHIAQEWARSLPGGTAVVIEVKHHAFRDHVEYKVRTGVQFSMPPGPSNPQTREEWWNTNAVLRARS